jgi:5-methylcytosine-specific restriction protein A
MSTKRRARDLVPSVLPDGTKCCACGCGKPIPKGRRSWASQACVEEWKIRNWPAVARQKVWKRDRGICAACGRDSAIMHESAKRDRSVWMARRPDMEHHPSDLETARLRYQHALNLWFAARPRITHHAWEMDHKLEVVNGGGQCGLDNLQTLCIACHRQKTRRLAAERAAARRLAKQPELVLP